MATKTKQQAGSDTLEIMSIRNETITMYVRGRTPLILNRIKEASTHELLFPRKKSASEKASQLKHDPLAEFRDSPYKYAASEDAPTLLYFPGLGFKAALAAAAVDVATDTSKAQIGRLTWIDNDALRVPIFGVPQIFSTITRSADMNRTPDVRTRAILPEWACKFSITFVTPQLNRQAIGNLFAAAGLIIGVGDFRSQKGKGNFGQFEIVGADDKDWNRIVKQGARAQQVKALETPEPYDADTGELLSWFNAEVKRRGFKAVA